MICSLNLTPRTLSLSPSIPHPLSKKSDIKQGGNPSWTPASVNMGQEAPQTTGHKCAVIASISG